MHAAQVEDLAACSACLEALVWGREQLACDRKQEQWQQRLQVWARVAQDAHILLAACNTSWLWQGRWLAAACALVRYLEAVQACSSSSSCF
jgi:hypothetical protein